MCYSSFNTFTINRAKNAQSCDPVWLNLSGQREQNFQPSWMDDVNFWIIAVAHEPEIVRLKKLVSLCSNIISCRPGREAINKILLTV